MTAPNLGKIGLFLILGVSASVLEGLGIGLLIPLLQPGMSAIAGGSPFLRCLDEFANRLPLESRRADLTLIIMLAIFLKATLAFSFNSLVGRIKSDNIFRLRNLSFRQILDVSQEYLDTQQSGSLLHILTGAIAEMNEALVTLLWLLLSLCTMLVFSILLMAISWQLTLATVATVAVVGLSIRWCTRQIGRAGMERVRQQMLINHLLKETLLGVRTVRAFGRERYEQERFANASRRARQLELKQETLIALAQPLTETMSAGIMVGFIYFALQAEEPLSLLTTVAFMFLRLQPHLQNVNINWSRLNSSKGSIELVMAFLATTDKSCACSGTLTCKALARGIRFDNVSFAYSQRGQLALDSVSFEIVKGKTTAIVGPSGSGKSTLVNLFCRFYEPGKGVILVDGQSLSAYDLNSWRERIALVSQDILVFSATIRENIAYGKLDATEQEIVQAAVEAGAHDFICGLPQGYDTLVGERGLLLSGGQRQRLSIARAFLRGPDILVLDEATNALDSFTETHIQASIEKMGRNRTVVVVAHRLSTIKQADLIVVLNQGRVVEQGAFAELLGRDGFFAALYRSHRFGLIDDPASA